MKCQVNQEASMAGATVEQVTSSVLSDNLIKEYLSQRDLPFTEHRFKRRAGQV